MKNKIKIALVLSASIASSMLAQNQAPAKPAGAPTKTLVKSQTQPDAGQRKFDANCSRCHNAPQQLSPALTGTVVRHMRVRANLSAQDEKDILKFLAP